MTRLPAMPHPIIVRSARLLALLLAFMLAPAARAQPAALDWSRTVTIAQNGAFLLGNPSASTRLVEYFSYTCPHCADFARESGAPLRTMIKSGQISVELRNYIRDGYDLTAALLARCRGADKFMAAHEAIFAGHQAWMAKVVTHAQAKDRPAAKDQTAQLIDMADKTGLTALMAKQGVAASAARNCLSNQANIATILALTASAWDADPNFGGTPTFLIDDKPLAGVHNWASLRPLLPAPPAKAK
jgi:protein-disulfide isomerase